MRFLRRLFTISGRNVIVSPADPPLGATLRAADVRWDVEDEHDRLADEQVSIWEANGLKAAKGAHAAAASASPLADGVRVVQDVARRRIDETAAAWSEASRRLHGHAPVTRAETLRYWVTLILVITADIASVAGSGVALGELPGVAFLQALGAGTAAATSGLIGGELRKRQMAHLYGSDRSMAPDDSAAFKVFGLDPDDLALRVAMVVVVAITLSVFLMRTVQGPAAAMGFALLALGSASCSFLNSWVHCKPAAEILDGHRQSHEIAQAEYLALAGHEAVAREGAALSEANSIEAEHAARGEAARQHILAKLWAVFRRHPWIFGHGVRSVPSTQPTTVPMAPRGGEFPARGNGLNDRPTELHPVAMERR